MDTTTSSPEDFVLPELARMLDTARRVIDKHVNDHGRCAGCGSLWPCQRTRLADFALASL